MRNKNRKRACQNCKYGTIIRYGNQDFPEVRCDNVAKESGVTSGIWDTLRMFGDICEDYEPDTLKSIDEEARHE